MFSLSKRNTPTKPLYKKHLEGRWVISDGCLIRKWITEESR